MLQAAISLFVIAILAFILGANNIAGVSVELGKILFFVFIALSIISFLGNLFYKKGSSGNPPLP